MKYLKTYEEELKGYQPGDYVLVRDTDPRPAKIIRNDLSNWGNVYELIFLDDPENSYYGYMDEDIIRKLEEHEIEAIKYNL